METGKKTIGKVESKIFARQEIDQSQFESEIFALGRIEIASERKAEEEILRFDSKFIARCLCHSPRKCLQIFQSHMGEGTSTNMS